MRDSKCYVDVGSVREGRGGRRDRSRGCGCVVGTEGGIGGEERVVEGEPRCPPKKYCKEKRK